MNRYSFFLHAFYGGGAEKVIITVANQLAQRGEQVDLVVGKAEGPIKHLVDSAVNVIDLDCDRTYKAIVPLARYLRSAQPLALLTSIIHANVVAGLAHGLARSPARLILREANPEHTAIQSFSAVKGWVMKRLAYWTYRRADLIISVSKALEKTVREDLDIRHPNAVAVIYNPITPDLKALSDQPLAQDLVVHEELPLVLGVGRLVEAKGFRILLKAVAKLNNTHPVQLVIAGQGDDLNYLESLADKLGISEHVSFPGFVTNPLPLMKRASVYVMSSYLEGMPNALIEALACGTPVVSTDCPTGPREVLENGKHGALVPMGDVDAMAQAIAGVLDGKAAQVDIDEFVRRFDLDVIVDQYLAAMNPEGFKR